MAKRKTKSQEPAEITEVCRECSGTGFIMTPEGVVPCECKLNEDTELRLKQARIPSMYSKKSLKTFKTKLRGRKKVLEMAKNFVAHYDLGGRGLLIVGGVGVGKTHIAVSMLKEIVENGFSGLYYNVVDLLRHIRSTYDSDVDVTENDILEITISVDVLVLDDLGAEKTSGWVLDRLYSIINKRYEEGRTLIVTTNCESYEELENKTTNRIASRLWEICPTWKFPEGDYRRLQ